MQSGSKKQIDIARLKADLAAASVELLSAHCAADRVRLQYSPQDIVAFGERHGLQASDRFGRGAATVFFPDSRPRSTAKTRERIARAPAIAPFRPAWQSLETDLFLHPDKFARWTH